jgi:putative transposase
MARIARVVVPGVPHHITQRGNRRQQTFFCEEDYAAYLALMAHWCGRCGVEVWAYCLMPNHVHMIAVPEREESLARAIGEAHRRYSRRVNLREGWTGYLWQGRFASFPMDEGHLLAAARYVEQNPVRARLVARAREWRWSSAAAHLDGRDDRLVKVRPLLERVEDWDDLLRGPASAAEAALLRRHERTGRPLGAEGFLTQLEELLGRVVRAQKRGRKPKREEK